MANLTEPLLRISELRVAYPGKEGLVTAVGGVSLDLHAGKIVAVVGESGSGKSTLVRSVIRLLPPAVHVEGSVFLAGREREYDNLLALPEKELRRVRGREVGFVPQSTSGALNPMISVRRQFELTLRGERLSAAALRDRAFAVLADAGVRDVSAVWHSFPHELSGGLAQRVVFALALCKGPRVLLADEPTTALDPVVQMDVLTRLRASVTENDSGALLVTHDLGVAARYADWVVVMRTGQAVENGPVSEILAHPKHPYTSALLEAGLGRGDQLLGEPAATANNYHEGALR